MAEAAKVHPAALTDWDGGAFPYAVGHRKLGMWLFIMSDSLTFAALLFGYAYCRLSSDHWPTPFPFNPSIIFFDGYDGMSAVVEYDDGHGGAGFAAERPRRDGENGSSLP